MKISVFLKKHYKLILLLAISLLFSLFLEAFFFTQGSLYDFSERQTSVLDDEVYPRYSQGYKETDNSYTPINNDPQIIISGINQNIKTLLIRFESKSHIESAIQIFFCKAGEPFSATNSVTAIIEKGEDAICVSLPGETYESIRLDINKRFSLADVVVSSGELIGTHRGFTQPFNFLRIFLTFLAVSLALILSIYTILRCKASDITVLQALSKTKNYIAKRPLIVLSALMVATSFIVFKDFLLCREIFIYSDIGSDTRNVYYPFFMAMQEKLETLDFSMWDFSYGLGTNILGRQTDVTSPFVWLTLIFGKNAIKYLLPFSQVLKLFVSGYLCYFYLSSFNFSSSSKVIASYVFAFNGFTMLWGQHYFFATAPICAVFVLFGIERALKHRNGYIWLIISVFCVAVSSYYFAYMILIMAAIYALFRIISIYSKSEFVPAVKRCGALLASVFLGIGMSAAIFIPCVYLILTTSARVGGEVAIFDVLLSYFKAPRYDDAMVREIVSRFFSNNLNGAGKPSGGLNYYESPQFFFSVFFVSFIFIFLLNILLDRKESAKTKVLKLASVFIIAALIFHPLMSVILNGFVTDFFRYTFILMPIFALLFADTLDKLINGGLSHARLQICSASVLSVFLFAKILTENAQAGLAKDVGETATIYIVLMMLFAFATCALQDTAQPKFKKTLSIAFIACLVVSNVSIDGYITTNSRIKICEADLRIYEDSGNSDVIDALDYIEQIDTSFHRTDKTFMGVCKWNDAMLEGYYGVSVYNSIINKNVIDFVTNACPELRNYPYQDGYYDFRYAYKNTAVTSIMGVKYILSDFLITDVPEYEYIKTFGGVHVYRNNTTSGFGKFYTSTIGYEDFISFDKNQKKQVLGNSLILDGAEGLSNEKEATAYINFERPDKSNYITGTVNTSEDGWLMMPIPYEDGWTAYVDGVKVEIVRGDIAFSAIQLSAGEHNVVFKYRTPMISLGLVISCISIAIFSTLCVISKIKYKKDKL